MKKTKAEQLKEMTEIMRSPCKKWLSECFNHENCKECRAEALYNADYRKLSELTPCDVCKFNPPSSSDGKPCAVCPAQAKQNK